jgi:hypothetical protein
VPWGCVIENQALGPVDVGLLGAVGIVLEPNCMADLVGQLLGSLCHPIALLVPTQELPTMCGLCGTTYYGDECPTCKTEREEAKRVIEERLRRNREEKDRPIRDVEVWLEKHSPDVRNRMTGPQGPRCSRLGRRGEIVGEVQRSAGGPGG